MLFRAIIYGTEHRIYLLYPNNQGNWFNFRGKGYRKDRKAIRQVTQKGTDTRPRRMQIVECIYTEGNPIPRGSNLDIMAISKEHLQEKMSSAANKPSKGFWDYLHGR